MPKQVQFFYKLMYFQLRSLTTTFQEEAIHKPIQWRLTICQLEQD